MTPDASTPPASPARAPEARKVIRMTRPGAIRPDTLAASGAAPTARTVNPNPV